MLIDNDALRLIQMSADKIHYQESILLCQTILRITHHGRRAKRFIVATESHLSLYEPKPFQKEAKRTQRLGWDTITGVSSPPDDPLIACFTFKAKEVTIFSEKAAEIIVEIVRHLHTILTVAEFSLDAVTVLPALKKRLKRYKDGVIRRLRFKSLIANRPLTPALDQQLSDWLHGPTPTVFDVGDFLQFPSDMDLIFDALFACRKVKLLRCPKPSGLSFWPHLAHFYALGGAIPGLETHESPTCPEFEPFIQRMMSGHNMALSQLRFCDADFDAAFMARFAILVECCTITTLAFENQITCEGSPVFTKLLSSVHGFQYLRALTLVGCPGLTPSAAISPLPSLRYWHWDDSEVDVSVFMSELCALPTCELEELVLKNGNASSAIPPGLILPPRLSTLTVTGVGWEAGSLESFLRLCADGNHGRRPLTLDLSDAQVDAAVWESVDALLMDLPLDTLVSLAWEKNPIGEGFARLLARNPALTALAIGESPHDTTVIGPLSDFIQSSKSLQALSLRGSESASFGAGMQEIMEGIYYNSSLVALDVSGNRVGDAILEMIGSLLAQHPLLSRIALDRNNIESQEDLGALFGLLVELPRAVQLQFPQEDLERQRTLGATTDKEIARFRDQCLACLQPDDAEIAVERDEGPTAEMTPLDIPGMLSGTQNAEVASLLTDRVQTIVHSISEAYISDALWMRLSFVEPPVDTDERLLAIKRRFAIAKLLDEIPD